MSFGSWNRIEKGQHVSHKSAIPPNSYASQVVTQKLFIFSGTKQTEAQSQPCLLSWCIYIYKCHSCWPAGSLRNTTRRQHNDLKRAGVQRCFRKACFYLPTPPSCGLVSDHQDCHYIRPAVSQRTHGSPGSSGCLRSSRDPQPGSVR